MKLVEELREALGEDLVGQQEPLEIDGVSLSVVVTPDTVDSFTSALRVLHEGAHSVLLTGGGTRLGFGNPPSKAELLLSTGQLRGIRELDADEGILQAYAGTPLSELRDACRDAGWELPLDPPGTSTTLGGALASAAVGPCFGHPRSVVLGLEMLGPDGTATRCGGRVVKNVTGYDLAKLYLGSLGSLGVIVSAWMRLLPLPQATEVSHFIVPSDDEGFGRALAASRNNTVRAAAVIGPELSDACGPGEVEVVIELAGDAAAVLRDGEELRSVYGANELSASAIEWLREHQFAERPDASANALFARLRFLPTTLPQVWSAIASTGAELFAYPNRGDLFARMDVADDGGAEILGALSDGAKAGRGSFVIESAPLSLKRNHDVFGADPALYSLTEGLKKAFDPQGVLNPGRFAGRL